MKFKLLLVAGLLFLIYASRMENFVNFINLSGFNDIWGDNAEFKKTVGTKSSDLVTGCDSNRGTCILHG